MRGNVHQISRFILVFISLWSAAATAQYTNLSANNQDIAEYVSASPENADTSVMYVFYSDAECGECAEAIRLIYNLYAKYYSNDFNIFSIDYTSSDYNYQQEYNLTQPLSIVLVGVANGQAVGYYKIDNPQQWLENDANFEENLLFEINNFLTS